MRGMLLSSASTLVAMLAFVTILLAAVVVSIFVGSSQATRIGTILTSTEQPLVMTSGLMQMRLLDGRTMLDDALHALGGSPMAMPPLATHAMQEWGIEGWQIAISGNRDVQLGPTSYEICGTNARCSSANVCPAGSYTLSLSSERCGDRACCGEDYDFTTGQYQSQVLLRGMPTCGPDGMYYGVCEPGGCSLGRKDMRQGNCPALPIGNHCCRPYTDEELAQVLGVSMNKVNIPLLYPGMNGTLTISLSQPLTIANILR